MAFERLGEKIPLFLRTDRILFRGTVDDDAKKIRSERLGRKPVTTVAALGQGNARVWGGRVLCAGVHAYTLDYTLLLTRF